MIDHIGIEVSDYQKALEFYKKALAPLGYVLMMEVQGFAGFGPANSSGPIANFWIHQGKSGKGESILSPAERLHKEVQAGLVTKDGCLVHVAFNASTRKVVDAFYEAAIAAGGKDHGKPGIREIYHPNYYGAFVLDPDGHNIEAVCHSEA